MFRTILATVLSSLFATQIIAQTGDDVHWSPQFGPPGANRFPLAVQAGNGQAMLTQICSPEPSCPIQFWDGAKWRSIGNLEGGIPAAQGLAHDGTNWYIGGSFTNVGGVPARNVAAWDGNTWRALGEGIAGYAGALLIHQGKLYAAGAAENGGSGAPMVRRFNGSSWEDLSTGFPNAGSVYSIVSDGDNIVAGGSFTTPGKNVARFTGTRWEPLGNGLDGTVNAVAIWKGELYAAGTFTGGMAKWTGTEWQNLGATFRPRAPTRLQPLDDGLYLAGDFTNINNATIRDLALYNGANFLSLSDENIGANITSLSADAQKLYFAGDFGYVDANADPGAWQLAQGVGTWNNNSFENLYNADFSNGVGFFVSAIGEHAGDIYAGGTFRAAGDASANYIARWDGDKWNRLGSGVENRNNSDTPRIDALLSHGGELFVGGAFTHAGGVASPNVAIWTGTEWRAAGEGLNGRVRRFVIYQGSVIATGAFNASGAQTIFFVARWNGSGWENLEAFGLGSIIGSQGAHEAVVADDTLYVGGALLADGGSYTNSVFQLVGDTYEFLGGFNRSISSMTVYNGELYVSGQFTRVNRTLTITNIAKWDGASWSAVASTISGQVNALAVHKGRLHAAGRFGQSTTVSNLNAIARLGDVDWEPVGSGLWSSPPAGANGSELYSSGDDLWIGGIFSKAGAVDAMNFARWNDQIDFYTTSSTEITVTSVTFSDNQVTLSIRASSPVPVVIEATTDFVNWSQVATGNGSFQETVPAIGNARYFRARTAE